MENSDVYHCMLQSRMPIINSMPVRRVVFNSLDGGANGEG